MWGRSRLSFPGSIHHSFPSTLVRNFMRRKTSNDYIRHVRTFTTFPGRSPDGAAAKDLRRCSPTQNGFPTSAVLRRITIQDGVTGDGAGLMPAGGARASLGVDHGE